VAAAQPKGDVSSAVGRAGMSESRVAQVESRAPHGAQPKSWESHGATEVGEGATQGLEVGPPGVAVGPPTSIQGAV
jgi:hypothetical protein